MKLLVISHKETWQDSSSPTGYSTIGGFPFQMEAIAGLFDRTSVMVPLRATPLPTGATPLQGHNLQVLVVPEPAGRDLRRKLALLFWLPRNLPTIWRAVAGADAVHAPVGGDIGTIGILVALAQRVPLFVRHCGAWGEPVTMTDRFLHWLLERIASGRNVVMATGGGESPPSCKNQHITWIFASTLTCRDLQSMPQSKNWQPGQPLKLVTVGRLTQSKNTAAAIRALPLIQSTHPDTTLQIVGGGEAQTELERLVSELDLQDDVTFNGNLPHARVLEILAGSNLFVFPTPSEGFPKALLEAMACGLPSIATRVSVIPHLIGEGCGVLLDSTDYRSVAKATLTILTDPDKMAEMGANARQVAMNYSLERWQELIGERLEAAWGPLKSNSIPPMASSPDDPIEVIP